MRCVVCLWSRRGERVLLSIDEFHAETFDDFFDGIASISWVNYIPTGAAFHVNGYSRDSKLFGTPACQSLCKKAIVKALSSLRPTSSEDRIFEDEKIGLVKVVFGIVKDNVNVMIDITGDGLHKRGYRPLMHEAPIKETLAAGMVSAAQYRFFGEEALVDPFCGSPMDDIYFYGSDIDPKAVRVAENNAKAAGVSDFVRFKVSDFRDQTPEALLSWTNMKRQLILCNPPYGGRLLTPEAAAEIYRGIASTYLDRNGYCRKGIRLSVITPDDSFENQVVRKKKGTDSPPIADSEIVKLKFHDLEKP